MLSCLVAARSEGRQQVPVSCPPTPEELRTTACPKCRSVDRWALQPNRPAPGQCRVFLPAAAAWTNFPEHGCTFVSPDGQRCSGTLSTDGRPYGILRHSPGLAYGHELMYQWSDRMASRGIAWYTMWTDIVNDNKGCAVFSRCNIAGFHNFLRVPSLPE